MYFDTDDLEQLSSHRREFKMRTEHRSYLIDHLNQSLFVSSPFGRLSAQNYKRRRVKRRALNFSLLVPIRQIIFQGKPLQLLTVIDCRQIRNLSKRVLGNGLEKSSASDSLSEIGYPYVWF